jgi:hypothetical protein
VVGVPNEFRIFVKLIRFAVEVYIAAQVPTMAYLIPNQIKVIRLQIEISVKKTVCIPNPPRACCRPPVAGLQVEVPSTGILGLSTVDYDRSVKEYLLNQISNVKPDSKKSSDDEPSNT